MNRFPSLLILSLLLVTLTTSQSGSIAYVQGCSAYAQDGCCQACEYGYTLGNGKCQQSNNTTTDCCASYNSDGSCAQCSAGLFYSDPYCYRNQIYGCIKKSGNTCLACGSGFTLQNGICVANIPNCVGYTNGVCNSCATGYTLVNAYCILTPPKVANCAQANTFGCILCSNGYYLTANLTCSAFAPGCLKYYREKCLACLPAFQLVQGVCLIDGCATLGAGGCTQCKSGYVLDNGKCFANNCAKVVNGKCVACKSPYRLSSSGCVQQASYSCKACQSGYVFLGNRCVKKIFGCLSYTSNNLCGSCQTNFQLTINGFCQIVGCSLYDDNGCLQCASPFKLTTNKTCSIDYCQNFSSSGCTCCINGYILNNGLCYPADPYCSTYTNATCTQCVPKYHLSKGICVINQRGCSYNSQGNCICSGYFVLGSSGSCIILGCSSYNSNDQCLSCAAPFIFNSTSALCYIKNCQAYTETSCKTCISGFTLVNGQCQQTDIYCTNYNSNGVCTCCQNGFSLDSASGKCIKIISNCASYSDQVTCQSCKSGFVLIGGSCIAVVANCVNQTASGCFACASGYRLNQGICVVGDVNCLAYALQGNSQVCTSCASGFVLQNGVCVKTQPGCVYSNGVCTSCSSPFIFDSSSNSCFIPGCSNYSSSCCLTCASPFTLSNGNCVIANCATYAKNGCSACVSGFSLVNGVCVGVDQNCLTFNSNNQCTACKQGFKLLNGKCVVQDSNCANYNDDGSCLSCLSTCFFDTKRKCQPKEIGCIYEGGICKFCTQPFVLNPVANLCVIKNCLQFNASGCLLCETPFIVSGGSCTLENCNNIQNNACVQCKVGYHLKKGVSCEIDSPDCLSYDSDGNCQLCKKGLTLTSNAVCSQLNSTCLQTCESDKFKCLSCASGYFLNTFFQCEKQDGKCVEYTNGVCSQCSERYFLFNSICFPYTAGCAQYCGSNCTVCKAGYTLKNGECFAWKQQDLSLIGSDDKYNFSITPIDVRQSKYYINNLSPGSELGKFFFSSSFDSSYQDCSLSTLSGSSGNGWKAATADSSQFVGLAVSDAPLTFYAVQLQSVNGNYITQFYLQYSVDGVNFIRVQNPFQVPATITANMTTIYFTGIYAKAIRIRINKFQGWPACRIDFFYYDLIRFRKISNLKSLKYLQDTINSNFVDRVDNQIYINQVYFFNPNAACTSKELCFTGLQLCQPRTISSLSLNFGSSGAVSEFYLTYSVDGRSYNCYNGCAKITVNSGANGTFNYSLNDLQAQGVRIYPTKYSGSTNFSPVFYYQ